MEGLLERNEECFIGLWLKKALESEREGFRDFG